MHTPTIDPARGLRWAKAALAAAAALAASACTMFESDRPMFTPSAGAPVYGAAPALVRWTMTEDDADPKKLRLDATFADGEYLMVARGKDKAQWRESLHPAPGLPPAGSSASGGPASGSWYVQQIAYADESDPTKVTYYYDLVRADGTKLYAYQFRCTDLTPAERDAFDMTPPPPPPNADGSPGAPSAACIVRSPDSVARAFALLASRLPPRAEGVVKPKGKGWFSRR
ncbi:MAG: hypothetical protein KJS97_14055 [Alphaproteobacteria bacterium]|nr:hypothetical protein [Alphaproteobacteria bacterium]